MGIKLIVVDANTLKSTQEVIAGSIISVLQRICDGVTLCLSSENSESETLEIVNRLGMSKCFDHIYTNNSLRESVIDYLHVSITHPTDCLVICSATMNDSDVETVKSTGVNIGVCGGDGLIEIETAIKNIDQKWLTLNRYIRDMESGLAGFYLSTAAEVTGWTTKSKPPMYGKTIRDFIRVYTSRQRRVAVEIGTGRAQLLTAMRLASPNTLILTCDICPASAQWVALAVDRYASSRWLNCTFIPNYEKEAPARSQMSEQFSELLNEDSSVKVDFLSLDGDISRKGLIEDLKWWLPHLSESCTIYFSGAILCHDSVKVLVDDICADFRTYRTCRDFEYDAGSDKKKSVSSVTKRPVKQDSVRISGAPSYSSERKILKRDFFEEGFWDEKAFDVKYELVMTHPGMIFFEKSSNISWDQILEKVKSLEA